MHVWIFIRILWIEYDKPTSSSPNISRQISSSSLDTMDSSFPSSSVSLSTELRQGVTDSFSSSSVQHDTPLLKQKCTFRTENKVKAYPPTQKGYHYVVPRSCWICNTTRMSKQKMKEIYKATLVYHRGKDQLEESINNPNS